MTPNELLGGRPVAVIGNRPDLGPTARRLGAVVQAYDVRPAVKEQVESVGARFVQLAIEGAKAEGTGGRLGGNAGGASEFMLPDPEVSRRLGPRLGTGGGTSFSGSSSWKSS